MDNQELVRKETQSNASKKLDLHPSCYAVTFESMLAIMNTQGFKNLSRYRDAGTRFSSFYSSRGDGGD